MSGTTQKTSNTTALGQSAAAVERVTGLIRNVLRKYPQNTLPPTLVPFLGHSSFLAVRRSSHADEVVMVDMGGFRKMETFRFPLTLLDAQESEITRWARDQYWAAGREAKARLRQAALARTKKARRALDEAQQNYDLATKSLAEVSAPTGKTRRAQALGSAKTAE